MPANSQIILKDGAATPVDHTYLPTKIDANNVATFQERNSGVPVGYPTLTWSLRAPTTGGAPTYKLIGKLTQPKVITTVDQSGKSVTSVDYTNIATVEIVVSNRSTLQERKDIRTLCANMLLNATLASSADNLESFW
jgi:hypothetical protein